MLLLVLALIAMLTLLATLRPIIALQVESVFAPRRSRKIGDASRMQNNYAGRLLLWGSAIVWIASLAIVTHHIVPCLSADKEQDDSQLYILIVIWACFVALRRAINVFINWVFFPKQARREWECVYRLTIILNALLAMCTTLIATCNNLNPQTTLVIAILAHIPGLFVTIWGCWRLFFGNLLGCLHFLLYLCTLECVLPIVAVFTCAKYIT